MTTAPVLHLPDFSLDFVVETYASNVGIGDILMQQEHPIAFFSKKLCSRLQASSTYTKELYAIVVAVHKWRQYLLGRFFIICSDHKSIRGLLMQVIQTPEQQIYVRKLLEFHFRIDYRTGSSNLGADALSRLPEQCDDAWEGDSNCGTGSLSSILATSVAIVEIFDILHRENMSVPELVILHQQFGAGRLHRDYSITNGILLFRHRYYIALVR